MLVIGPELLMPSPPISEHPGLVFIRLYIPFFDLICLIPA